ncbi:MAG: N-acetylmuramoyl-L-alanine amidase [Verrucomicrobiales bacterium]|nr:N-acetylmuramoyl-L-alanine amidase [Verrucomicrobiales bacterium]
MKTPCTRPVPFRNFPRAAAKTALLVASVQFSASLYASTDYGPAIYRPMSGCSKWYTSGSGHKFVVIHDMEGYYASTISYLNRCDIATSIHYMVNGKVDTSSDYSAGEVDQQVRESLYSWHARCWNTYSAGTEHEGFADNPAWFTEALYQASADLQRHLCDDSYSIVKDRNHIVGHNAWQTAAWRTYAASAFGIDPNCNTHHDPGAYWDWSHFMALINPVAPPPASDTPPLRYKVDVNGDGKTDIVLIWNNAGNATIRTCLSTGSAFASAVDTAAGISFGTLDTDRKWIPLDANGDGKTDMVLIWKNGSAATARTYISTGTGFTYTSSSTVSGGFGTLGVDREWSKADVNGDGKEDLIMIWNNAGVGTARICPSSGTSFSIGADSVVAGGFGTLGVDRQWIPMDVNADGKSDLVMVWDKSGEAAARVCRSSGTNFTIGADSILAGGFGTLNVDRQWLKADINGDGKQDLIMIWDKAGEAAARVCLTSGTNFTLGADTIIAGTYGTIGLDRQWIPMDINGDGKTDLTMIWNHSGAGDARTCLSTGTGFTVSGDTTVCGSFGTLGVNRMWSKGDIDGDGKEDLIMIWNNVGDGIARACLTTGSGFGITSDSTVCGTFGTFGVDRLWLPPGL